MVEHEGRQQLGNYRLLYLLEQSLMVAMYLGEHIHLHTQATIKVFQGRLNKKNCEDFLRQARQLARLEHPHIVRIRTVGIEGLTPFIVLDYGTVSRLPYLYPAGIPLLPDAIVDYVQAIADALQYAHDHHILHRSLRPECVLLESTNRILIDDFGLSMLTGNSRTQSFTEALRSAIYMAPEQLQGKAGPASDQYALAVMVYEWLSGKPPFQHRDYAELVRQHVQAHPPRLQAVVPHLAPAVADVVMKALRKDPAQRFARVKDFASAFEQAALTSEWSESRPVSRRVLVAGLVGLAGLTAVGTGAIWLWTRQPPLGPSKTRVPVNSKQPAGTLLFSYREHKDVVYALSWSPDGKHIASWGHDDMMHIWDALTGETLASIPMANVAAWSPDWKRIVSGDMLAFQVWDSATRHQIFKHDVHTSGSGPNRFLSAEQLAFSPDGHYLAAATDDFTIYVWNINTGHLMFNTTAQTDSAPVAWSPDSQLICFGLNDFDHQRFGMQIQDIKDRKHIIPCVGHSFPSSVASWSPSGRYIASACRTGLADSAIGGNDSTVRVWDATNGQHIATYSGHPYGSDCIAWSPDSTYIASLGYRKGLPFDPGNFYTVPDPTVHIWEATSGHRIRLYPQQSVPVAPVEDLYVNCIAWSPDGTFIASACNSPTVEIWRASGK